MTVTILYIIAILLGVRAGMVAGAILLAYEVGQYILIKRMLKEGEE